MDATIGTKTSKASETADITATGFQDWGRRLAADVQSVLTQHPGADAEIVRLTLIALQSSPLERLNRSLRRGRGFAAFRR